MNDILRKRRRLLFIALAIFIFLAVSYALLPRLFQLTLVHEKIYAVIARQVPGDITYRKEALTLFPAPCIHFYDVQLKIDRQFSGTIDEIAATPHFFSLLRGRFNISKLTLAGGECTAEIPGQARSPSPETALADLGQRLETWADMLEQVRKNRFVLDIEDCALTLTREGNLFFSLRDIGGRLKWRRPVISLDMTSRTDLYDPGRLLLDANVSTREISGRLTAKNVHTSPGAEFLFAGTPLRLEDAVLDTDISWRTDDFETWRLSIEALNPDITFSNNETRFSLQGKKAGGEIWINETGIHASISELDLDSPGLRLTGEFDLDTERPFAGWQVNADALDIASARTAMMFFAGRSKVARNIARVFQDGGIKQLAMGQEAETLDGLRKVATFHLRGHLDGATVSVPKADLLLTESFGTVAVSGGFVNATDLETRLGNSTGSRGSFTMPLIGEKPWPWSVVCDVQADLAQLPPLLERLTPGTVLAREMAGIESAAGSADGTLVLERSTDGLEVSVDVSKFDLSAAYHRIPFPVTLSGDRFFYQGHELQVEGVRGNIGASHVSDLDAGVTWEAAPHLSISSASAEVDADELAGWLGTRFTGFRDMNGAASCTGRVSLDRLQFDGPVGDPKAWRFQTDGAVAERLTIRPPLFSEVITVDRGQFSATHERIDALDVDASVLDTTLFTSGYLEGYLTEIPRVLDLHVTGALGRKISERLMTHAAVPKALQWRTPATLAPVALRWEENGNLDISGDAAFETGLRVSFELKKANDEFTSGRLDLRYNDRHAAAALTREEDSLGLRFAGELSRDAVSSLLVENRLLAGTLSGDFNVECDLKPPYLKSLTGDLQADHINLEPVEVPLKIEQAAVTGNGADTDIDTARFEWKEIGLTASGRVSRTDAGLLLDLALAAGHLEWPDIKALMDTTASPEAAIGPFLLGEVRFACNSLSLSPTWTFQPFEAHLELDGERTDIVFRQADACGISFPGTLSLTTESMHFDFKPSATEQDLEPTVGCLKKGDAFMDGRFDLTGDIAFQWDRSGSIWEAIEGSASLTAVDGRIYKGGFFGKLFSMLNVSELLSGRLPDFEKEGFPYETSSFKGKFNAGSLELETGVIDSPAMKIFFEGTEDLIGRQHALTIVVAPLKTLDAMVDKIPLLSDVLEKGLVVYPVKVAGGWEEPQLALLSPTAVGGEVLGIMLRTLRTPVTLFEKILPENKADQE